MAAAAEWETVSLEPVDWDSIEREPFQRQFIDPEAFVSKDGDLRREKLGIVIEDDAGVCVPAPVASFEELGVLPDYAFWGMKENGVTAPMPIQAQALPLVLAGHDVVGLAQTGSGKTLSFLLPAVAHIEVQAPLEWCAATPITLVLAPTRELAVQIAEEASKVLRHSRRGKHPGGCWAVCVYGGGNKRDQVRSLSKGAHIVAATPGRLIDLLTAKAVSLERVTYFVLDEADRMLDMGFQGDVAAISGQIRPERQVLFFSATWSRSVQTLARGLCYKGSQPVRIAVGQCGSSTGGGGAGDDGEEVGLQARAGILQDVIVVDYPNEWDKQAAEKRKLLEEYLRTVLGQSRANKVLVFVSQKTLADELCSVLWEAGFHCGAMHGGKPQESRLWTLDKFRKGELQLLVATDVLGRGIDVPSISHVVVYDMGSIEDYIHRIGRTARGKDARGCALVFFEYYFRDPQIAGNLIAVLEAASQPVPDGLRRIAEEVERGARDTWDARANWGKGMKINGNERVGVGIDGTWARHLEAAATSGGSSGDGNGWEPEPQVPFKVIPVPTWLEELDKMNTSATGAGGSMVQFASTLQQRNLDTVGDVLAEYAQGHVFAAEDFFRDIGVKKYGHKNVFRKWFREICAGG